MTNQSISQQNLDRLHVQWILGKNRGVNKPLVKEQLVQLLDAGRLHWSQLSKLEQRELTDDRNLVEQVEEWRNTKISLVDMESEQQRIAKRVANMTTLTLIERAKEKFPDFFSSKDWSELDREEKERTEDFLFGVLYGSSVDNYRINIYKSLLK